MAAISLDLRQRILSALKQDSSSFRVAERFEVSASFVRKLRCLARDGADLEPQHGGGKPRLVKEKHERKLLDIVAKHPDATLVELSNLLRPDRRVSREDTVAGDGVKMDVEVQRATEALDVGDAGALHVARRQAEFAGAFALPAEDLVGDDLVEARDG